MPDQSKDNPSPHRFLLAGDSCAGVPGGSHEASFERIVATMAPLAAERDFICFLGDHIMGATRQHKPGAAELARQWTRWKAAFAPVATACPQVFHLTSNHDTFDTISEDAFRRAFPELPQNGAADDCGLSYFVKPADDLLLVGINAASSRLGPGHVETEWLVEVLEAHASVPHKLVLGHYPVLPVNGYADHPMWRIPPDEGDQLWSLLVEHRVLAYLCSHIIAFDVRARDGVLQLCTGGAGTNYGPGGFMRGGGQFHHFVDCRLDQGELNLSVIDDNRQERATVRWPPRPAAHISINANADTLTALTGLDPAGGVRFQFSERESSSATAGGYRQALICGSHIDEGPPTVWIGLEGDRLVVELVLCPGGPVGRWIAKKPPSENAFAIELRPEFGPGGVFLVSDKDVRTTLETSVSEAFVGMRWPESWVVPGATNTSRSKASVVRQRTDI